MLVMDGGVAAMLTLKPDRPLQRDGTHPLVGSEGARAQRDMIHSIYDEEGVIGDVGNPPRSH